jgi:hypothetical protein
MSNKTWSFSKLPYRRMAIGYCWVFHIKYKVDGTLERYKARLVVKGYICKC